METKGNTMGDRAQVKVGQVYLYTHWSGTKLLETVKRALAKRWRWTDEEYLARIVFQEMLGNDRGETGFGIGIGQHGDIEHPLIVLDCDAQVCTLWHPDGPVLTGGSFEELLADADERFVRAWAM